MQRNSNQYRELWPLQPDLKFLNHGSFGACPQAIVERQHEIRLSMERRPIKFFVRDLERLLDDARTEVADFLCADPAGLVFVTNATEGVNAVLRSLRWVAGDEIVITNHGYNAVNNAVRFVAERAGAVVVVAEIPFPISSPKEVVDSVLATISDRTRLVVVDHITSPTGLVLPIDELTQALQQRGVQVLVDGAHGPGMVDLDLERLGADYYTGNFHKWVCAPKGAAFLYIHPSHRDIIRPLSISHGANFPTTKHSRLHLEFDWTGTWDPSAYLCVPEAIRYVGGLVPGGWVEIRRRNRELVLSARRHLCEALGIPQPAPDNMIGSLASLPLSDGSEFVLASPMSVDPLQMMLVEELIEVPIVPWPTPPKRLVRVSAHIYNGLAEYEALAAILPSLLDAEVTDRNHG